MMALAALIAGLVAFIVVLRALAAQRHALQVIEVAQEALGVITDPDLSDNSKEKRIRHASLSLMKSFAILFGISLVACLSAILFVVSGNVLNLFSTQQAIDIATSWSFILWSSASAVALWFICGKLVPCTARAETSHDEVPYSALDRAMHNFAFSSPEYQLTLSAIEDRFWHRKIAATPLGNPVFVTSLPRAGTTILLELLARQKEFAAASYRNMPFTFSPLLYGRFSTIFRKTGEKAERAHGDGIKVNIDSPEAFEEMIWMAFWRDRYHDRHIELWDASDNDPEFTAFLSRHMRKIILNAPGASRYVSKNNANIARLPLLNAMYPQALFVIPVRDPVSQISSLMRQHRRFTELHARDRFARQYMEGIGHFEFGAALKPIVFPGAPESANGAEQADYWLRYWIAAYAHVLRTAPENTLFIDHATLSCDPGRQLPLLAAALDLDQPEDFCTATGMFRAPRRSSATLPVVSPHLARQADALYAQLQARTL